MDGCAEIFAPTLADSRICKEKLRSHIGTSVAGAKTHGPTDPLPKNDTPSFGIRNNMAERLTGPRFRG